MMRMKIVCESNELVPAHHADQLPALGTIVSIGGKDYEVVNHRTEYESEHHVNAITAVIVKEASAPKGTKAAHGKKELRG